MIALLKKYKAFLFGFIVIVPIFYLLDYIGFIILPEERSYEIVIYAIIWGSIIALPFHYYKKNRKTVLRVLSLFTLLIVTIIFDGYMKIPDNPVTVSLIMAFWFGFAYLLTPTFIKKYWKLIALFYGPIFLYFFYLRLFSGDVETYLKIKEDFLFFLFVIPLPILFFVWVFEQWKWLQSLKAEKTKAELEMLQAQVNPHFFFNTLNNLYALTIKNSGKAPEVILKLSEMMRYTIYEGKKDLVPIKDEIEYLTNYIELHKIRYRNEVDIQFTNNVDQNFEVAPLLFIILLENAFKHGLEKNPDNGFIYLDLNADSNQIEFIIKNSFEASESNETHGIGLENLKRRLDLSYPKKYDLNISNENSVYLVKLKIDLS